MTVRRTDDELWRITYFGFSNWQEALQFQAKVNQERPEAMAKARRATKLSTKFEVQVKSLTKEDVIAYMLAIGEPHVISFRSREGYFLVDVLLNKEFVGRTTPDCQGWITEKVQSFGNISHRDAVNKLSKLLLYKAV
jgi:hypothetical protein